VTPPIQEGHRDLRSEAAPTGIGPSGFIPSAQGEFETSAREDASVRSQWGLFRRRFMRHKIAVLSVGVLLALIVLCFGANFFAPYSNTDLDLLNLSASPGSAHWLGTDQLGRDHLTRLLYAGQISLKIGFAVAIISTIVGTAVGAIAGYVGKGTDQFLMRVTDLFLVIPAIAILAMALEYFGHTDTWIIIVLAFLFWMYVARVVRGEVLSLKEKEFIEAARASGASQTRIIVRHIIPNIVGSIAVNTTLSVAAAIITESTLSFLGFGVQPPQTSWGAMLSNAEGYISIHQHLLYAPGMMILITVLAVNFIGDGLRDAFDPQSEKH
jgi:peptide/nickel transport system permease protein